MFGIEREMDLTETPALHRSWRVPAVYPGLDERSRDGDDFPARVYAVIDGGWLAWRTRAINYVWASEAEAGSAWPNPFKEQAMMVAVQSGTANGWVHESRNVRADFKAQIDIEAEHIDGVALMVDCDNHGGRGKAYFGDVYFTPAGDRCTAGCFRTPCQVAEQGRLKPTVRADRVVGCPSGRRAGLRQSRAKWHHDPEFHVFR